MANAIQKRSPTQSPAQLSLPCELARLDSDDSVFDIPQFTPGQIDAAKRAIVEYQQAMTGAGEGVAKQMVAQLAMVLPKKARSDSESAFLVATYAEALSDIPADILRNTYQRLIREQQFFPTIMEIRKAAGPEMAKRSWLLARMRAMVARGAAPEEPEQYASPDDVARIKAEVAASLAA